MKQILIYFFVLFSLADMLFAKNVPPISSSHSCYEELQTHFFERNLVLQALSLYQIPQGLWEKISQTLELKSYQISNKIKKMTSRLVPNPLDYPMQKEAAAQLLYQVLKDTLYETMTEYQVNERPTSDFVFDYIFERQFSKFLSCFGESALKLKHSFE